MTGDSWPGAYYEVTVTNITRGQTFTPIPGPFFAEGGGPGGGSAAMGGEEGYVHVHEGIHGIADLVVAERDWRNPVARVAIQRVR